MPKEKLLKTSRNNKHIHNWTKKSKFTSIDDGHKHKIDIKLGLALPNRINAHFHRLIFNTKRRRTGLGRSY